MAASGTKILIERADAYCTRKGIVRNDRRLGAGKDGSVWSTSRPSALKVHERLESYQYELDAYTRFRDVGLTTVAGFKIPSLIGFDDQLWMIEMTIVMPPFVVDFASVRLDDPPDLIEDEGNTLQDMIRDRFGDRADVVTSICDQLIGLAGAYLSDLHPHNIKFGDD